MSGAIRQYYFQSMVLLETTWFLEQDRVVVPGIVQHHACAVGKMPQQRLQKCLERGAKGADERAGLIETGIALLPTFS